MSSLLEGTGRLGEAMAMLTCAIDVVATQLLAGPVEQNVRPASPLDRPLVLTIFNDKFARQKQENTTSLRDFAREVLGETADEKERLPWVKAATFGDEISSKNSLRHNGNVRWIDGIEADYDGEQMSVADAVGRLKAASIAALIYTSPSHTSGAPRWRVLCPTSKPLPAGERHALVARLNGVLDGQLADESFTLSQAYFYGSVRGNPAHAARLVEGRYIDEAEELQEVGLRRLPTLHEPGDISGDYSQQPVDKVRSAVACIGVEWRDLYLKWILIGAAIHAATGGSEEGLEIWKGFSCTSPHWDEDEIERKWGTFTADRAGGVTAGTLYYLAKKSGWQCFTAGQDAGLRFLTPSQCAVEPSRGSLIKGMLAPGDLGCIFGPPGAGKSTIAPFLAYMVAQGRHAFDMRTRQGGILYVAAEDGHGLTKRVHALLDTYGDAPDFLLTTQVADLYSPDSPDLAALLAEVKERRPALVIIDTLAAAFPGLEENSSESMARVVEVGRKLTADSAAVVLIHHGTKADGGTPRGHGVLNGALDMTLQVNAAVDGIVRAKLIKNRNGPIHNDIAFRITSCELGLDEDGEAITAALIAPLEPGLAKEHPRLTRPEQEALEVLGEMVRDGGAKGPSGYPAANQTAWRDALKGRVTVDGDDASKRTAELRAMRSLVRKGCVCEQAGWVWKRPIDDHVDWDTYPLEDAA